VEQELLTIREHQIQPLVLCGVRNGQSLVVCVIIVCPVLFLLAIVLFVFRRVAAFGYTFGIFQLFLNANGRQFDYETATRGKIQTCRKSLTKLIA